MESADLRAMRALTHPLRLDLMELLAANGPATAAVCGRALGVPQANCSFHLRRLAKYGYVEEADQGADRRERRWRVAEARPAAPYLVTARPAGTGSPDSEPRSGREHIRVFMAMTPMASMASLEQADQGESGQGHDD